MRWDEEYTRQVREGFDPNPSADPLSHCALGLAGESGEVADLIKKSQYRNGSLDETRLVEELGDALWYLTAIADLFGWSLAEIATANAGKLQARRGKPYDSYAIQALT
jgi:NTP pyrophosphatase (non-canonical NTP hydrolase)